MLTNLQKNILQVVITQQQLLDTNLLAIHSLDTVIDSMIKINQQSLCV